MSSQPALTPSSPASSCQVQVQVAVQQPPFLIFTYLHHEPLTEGVRVQVPFGRLQCLGVVVSKHNPVSLAKGDFSDAKLKAITKVIDLAPLYSPTMIWLAHFLSSYYFHPLGEVFRSMLPGAPTEAKDWLVEHHLEKAPHGALHAAMPPAERTRSLELLSAVFPSQKRRVLRKATFQKKLHELLKRYPQKRAKKGPSILSIWL